MADFFFDFSYFHKSQTNNHIPRLLLEKLEKQLRSVHRLTVLFSILLLTIFFSKTLNKKIHKK